MAQPIDLQSVHKEGRMTLALQAYRDGHFTSKRAVTVAYDILETTLRARLQGRSTRRDLRSANLKLTSTEETVLVR